MPSETKITVCNCIGQVILPEVAKEDVTLVGERVRGKINEYVF